MVLDWKDSLSRVHPGYNSDDLTNPFDIALVRLKQDIDFTPGIVAPICLESFDLDLKDKPKFDRDNYQAFAAGWGLQEDSVGCNTDGVGPETFTWCKFPFEFNGKTYDSCVIDAPTPSASNPICQKVKAKFGDFDVPSRVHWIDDSGTKRQTMCYPFSPGQYGWCGTCLDVS